MKSPRLRSGEAWGPSSRGTTGVEGPRQTQTNALEDVPKRKDPRSPLSANLPSTVTFSGLVALRIGAPALIPIHFPVQRVTRRQRQRER